MLGIPSTVTATIQPEIDLRNHYFAAFGQDSWRIGPKLTVNYGLRVEWEDGISEDNDRMIVGFDPTASLAIAGPVEAAYARSPLPQLAGGQLPCRGRADLLERFAGGRDLEAGNDVDAERIAGVPNSPRRRCSKPDTACTSTR